MHTRYLSSEKRTYQSYMGLQVGKRHSPYTDIHYDYTVRYVHSMIYRGRRPLITGKTDIKKNLVTLEAIYLPLLIANLAAHQTP